MRADNYALSEHAKRLRDEEQGNLTDTAYADAIRLISKHRAALDRMAHALLEKETLHRAELDELLADAAAESDASGTVGRVVPLGQSDTGQVSERAG